MRPTYRQLPGVSNAIRYDTLLVRELTRELNERLRGARLDAVFFDRERLRVTLQTRAPRRSLPAPPSLLWQLHPTSGHLTPAPAGAGAGRLPVRGAVIRGVSAPPDERIVVFELAADAATPDRVIVELVTNQWNAAAVAADDRIVALLRERDTRSRPLRTGGTYTAPRPSGRAGADAELAATEWMALLAEVPPAERLRMLPRLVAYTSPLNAGWILGQAGVSDAPAALERAYERYRAFATGERLRPVLLHDGGTWLPYVWPEGAGDVGEPCATLLAAFAAAATRSEHAPAAAAAVEDALAAIAERLESVDRRRRRLEEEQRGATEEAERLRRHADILLARLHTVRRGMERVELEDFEGGVVAIELDPALGGAENATRLYDTARRRDRAAARIPALLRTVGAEVQRLEMLAARVREGAVAEDELARLAGTRSSPGRETAPALPYRTYRTTGGIEVRVGRGSRSNDDLTFRHSSPNDIWLHARDVAGAHVILRWGRADANPAAQDIAEAAILAALHSRARSSGTVPVDWTRRKYVRKPRKAGPGLVIPERVRTVFVEPDARLEEQLRAETDGF
jgi:predicted ribosome quality control (RQC) complex YloA/Tae2 family protein